MKLNLRSRAWLVVMQAVAWKVEAASSDCAPSSGSFTIKTSQDISTVTACSTFTGSISVDGPSDVALDGMKSVTGNIEVKDVSSIKSLSSSSLESVAGLNLSNLPQLSKLDFSSLKNFSSLTLTDLPSLERGLVALGVITGEVKEVTVQNTALKRMDWLKWPVAGTLKVISNPNLTWFQIPYDIIHKQSEITISNNTALESIATSQLTVIDGGLNITGNAEIGFGFIKLETITGYVSISGTYTNITMPALHEITGKLSVESTHDMSALCNGFSAMKLTGQYDCTLQTQKNEGQGQGQGSGSGSTPTGGQTTQGSSVTANPTQTAGTGHAETKSPSSTVTVLAIVFAVLLFTIFVLIAAFFFFRRRSRGKVREIEPVKTPKAESIELGRSNVSSQVNSPTFPKELEGSIPMPQELEAEHGKSELGRGKDSQRSVHSLSPLFRHELPA